MRIIIVLLFIASCSLKKERKLESLPVESAASKFSYDFEIEQLEYLRFRRNYSYSEEINENEKLRRPLDNRNPEGYDDIDSVAERYNYGFEKLNLFDKDGKFNIKVWEKISKIPPKKIRIQDREHFLNTKYIGEGEYSFEIKNDSSIVVANNYFKFSFPPDVSFYVYDLDNDKQDEIISMWHWYIANGDNYEFSVYEVRKNFR